MEYKNLFWKALFIVMHSKAVNKYVLKIDTSDDQSMLAYFCWRKGFILLQH